jgi:hypothetical protein
MWQALLTEAGVDAGLTRLPAAPISDDVRATARANLARLREILSELNVPW